MPQLGIVRHGQSVWNKENKFTGWVDVSLSEKGMEEARQAGRLLAGSYHFDVAFTSALERAQKTLELILETTGQTDIPVIRDQALNERMYGDLQGANKDDMRARYGDEQVRQWRRSFDMAPPNGESLKDTYERVMPYYHQHIAPELNKGKHVLIAAHGNSLRALIMHLESMGPEDILKVEIPTGQPKIYDMDDALRVEKAYFLDPSLAE